MSDPTTSALIDADGRTYGYDFGGYVHVEWSGVGQNGYAVTLTDCDGAHLMADGLTLEEREALVAAIYANPVDDREWPEAGWQEVER